MTDQQLAELSIEAMGKSYAPYSGYNVGAALLSKGGRVFTGCNIENASYTPTVCAERTAFFKAVSEGVREFEKIAVCGGKNGKIEGAFPPCGVCRQVMAEFCARDFEILVVKSAEEFDVYRLDALLPLAFGPAYIN